MKREESPDGAAVSRSGRPRRKASKLSSDFQSSEQGELKQKKNSLEKAHVTPVKAKSEDDLDGEISDFDDIDIKDEDDWDLPDDDSSFLKLTDDDFRDDQDLDPLGLPPHDLEFGDDDFDVDDGGADNEDSMKDSPGGVAQSLYFSEKQSGLKKGYYYKNGQHIQRKKAQRKDKGKSRFTAYMLWAREVRPDIIKKHPDMDFASVNKKLGELWQLVPTTQKYNWKRRAKRLAVRLRQGGMICTGRTKGGALSGSAGNGTTSGNTTLVNSPTKQGNSSSQALAGAGAASGGGAGCSGRQTGRRGSPAKGNKHQSPQRGREQHSSGRGSGSRSGQGRGSGSGGGDPTSPTSFKVTGNAAIDVAAHMKLLGESLNNIGHKLKEHEGQIAVSGSLSVLLDSMLCVLGPLMCLTDQVEETRGAIEPQTHSAILDNIAYIMPGIV